MQRLEPSLASFLHSNIMMHHSLEKSMAFLLANKLASRTLLATQLVLLISEAYQSDAVRHSLSSVYFWSNRKLIMEKKFSVFII